MSEHRFEASRNTTMKHGAKKLMIPDFLIHKPLVKSVVAFLIMLSAVFITRPVIAQQAPFLVSPYYGTKPITSYFDHKYPTYSCLPNGNQSCNSSLPLMLSPILLFIQERKLHRVILTVTTDMMESTSLWITKLSLLLLAELW